MYLQKLDRGAEAIHGEGASRDEEESDQYDRCRREEVSEPEGNVDDTCSRTCRPCVLCQSVIMQSPTPSTEAFAFWSRRNTFLDKTNLRSRSLSLSRSLSIVARSTCCCWMFASK